MTKHVHFGLIYLKDIVTKVLRFVQMQLFKPKPCCHVLSQHTILVQSFYNCTVMTFNILTEACRVWGVVDLVTLSTIASLRSLADVFPPWHCVNMHLNVPDQQTAKTSAFTEVITLADDHLIKCIWLAAPECYSPSSIPWKQRRCMASQF